MYDVLVKGGLVVDGSGAPAYEADIGIVGGKIVDMGELSGRAARTIDAQGMLVTPGFIDPHTHYDAQLLWDPYASPSNLHGVTTIVGGNCGFSLAPLLERDADYTRRMMAVVEGMPLEALEEGIDWNWNSFADYIKRLEGNVAINAAFMVGHSALRRAVMGEQACEREASDEELEQMRALMAESLEAGALGFSSSRSFSHVDGAGGPVPSRFAAESEVLALCEELKSHKGTSLEFMTSGCLTGLNEEEITLMSDMSVTAQRALNWNVFTIDSKDPDFYHSQLGALEETTRRGARVVALTMPVLVGMTMSFRDRSPLYQLPGWPEIMNLPLEEKMQALRDPDVRRKLEAGAASPEAGVYARNADWPEMRIGDTFCEENRAYEGRLVKDIAAEREAGCFDTLVDILLADELRTVLWPKPTDDDDESWQMRVAAWDHPNTMLGGSDAGAHLDIMCGSSYPTEFLADCLRGRKLVSVERAVQMLTSEPAQLFGFTDRGQLREGAAADVLVIDPSNVGRGDVHISNDLPGNSARMFAYSTGVKVVMVNGVPIVENGRQTGALPGAILRSGQDTATVAIGEA